MLGQTVELLSQLLWGRGTIALTLLCGLYFTAGTGFLPLTRLPTVLKRTVGSLFQKRDRKSGGVSPFAAVSTALGGTMGVGNIVGVGAALALGGAGSIFWMWIGAFLGMMTKYARCCWRCAGGSGTRAQRPFAAVRCTTSLAGFPTPSARRWRSSSAFSAHWPASPAAA